MEKIVTDDQLKARLLATDESFRQLVERHTSLDQRLVTLESMPYLSEEEQMEEIRLKKQKLRAKDEMLAIMSRHKAERVM